MFVVVGLLLLLVRRIGGNEIVDSLVKVPVQQARRAPGVDIATSLLFAIAVALIVYGVVFALAAWLGGRPARRRFLRKLAAPSCARPRRRVRRGRRPAAWARRLGADAGVQAIRLDPRVRRAARARASTVLRRQTAVEFPDSQHGDAMREQRERREAARARKSAAGALSGVLKIAGWFRRPSPARRRARAAGGPPRLRAAVRHRVRHCQDANHERLLDGRLLRLGDPGGVVLVIGALIALRFHIGLRTIGLIMGFGAGAPINALSFDLVEEAVDKAAGGGWAVAGLFCRLSGLLRRRPVDDRLGGGGRKKPQGQAGGSSL